MLNPVTPDHIAIGATPDRRSAVGGIEPAERAPPPWRQASRIGGEAAISAASRSRREIAPASARIAPPAFASTPALASWSWSSACGSGTRIAGRPIAASSATVEAPERDTTRWLAAMRAGRSAKNGATSAVDAEAAIGVAHARRDPPRAPAGRSRAARAAPGRAARSRPARFGHDARALAAAEHEQPQRPSVIGAG